MAFMGIATTLLPTGKTVRKTFALLFPLFADHLILKFNLRKLVI